MEVVQGEGHVSNPCVIWCEVRAFLNLIEPWWKVMKSLALKGRRFPMWDEKVAAFATAEGHRNGHRHPFVWVRRRRHRPRRRSGVP